MDAPYEEQSLFFFLTYIRVYGCRSHERSATEVTLPALFGYSAKPDNRHYPPKRL